MDELGSFDTLAEIALGIAGFSGVVVAVSDRPAHQERSDSLRILSLLVVSLGALVLALLPSGLALAEVPRAWIWRGGSAAAVVGSLAWAAPVFATVGVLSALNLGAQLLNSAGLFPGAAASIYYFGIVWALLVSAAIFVNVVFRRPER